MKLKIIFSLYIFVLFQSLSSADLIGSVTNGIAILFKPPNEENRKIRLIHYQGNNNITYNVEEPDGILQNIDSSKPFVLYAHGYKEHISDESVQTMVEAYLKKGQDNIIVVDWTDFAWDNYVYVAKNARFISENVAKSLARLVSLGLDTEKIHAIGHSLGGQIVGFLASYLDFQIPRVTGLDPANPLFYRLGSEHINETSGRFVDIIHTDGEKYGGFKASGTVDFYPNGGYGPQPGCSFIGLPLTPKDLCSHWRSWRYYAETVNDEKAFPSTQCDSYINWKQGKCDDNDIIYFGYNVPKNASGIYYFSTNEESPFSRGYESAKY